MKSQIKYVIFTILLYSCTVKDESVTIFAPKSHVDSMIVKSELFEENLIEINTKDKVTFNLKQWVDSFVFNSKINCFNEDSISHFVNIIWEDYDSYKNYSTPIIGELAQQITGIVKLEPWHLSINEGTDFLYSIQKQKDHIGITVIGGNDAWVNEIRYLSFDLEGTSIGDVVLAAEGGDGGYQTRGHGCFLNDSTYKYEFIETEHNFETKVDEVYETGYLIYLIHSNGEIETVNIN